MKRLQIRNTDIGIACEAPNTCEGLDALRQLRKEMPTFKRRRIKQIIQMQPDEVPITKESSPLKPCALDEYFEDFKL